MTSKRKRLPTTRESITHHFVIHAKPTEFICSKCKTKHQIDDGMIDGYITVGLYKNKKPGEIFVKLSLYGDTVQGLVNQWATMASILLQHGISLALICSKGEHSRFEPSGITDTFVYDDKGNKTNKVIAKSVIDYICRWLQLTFLV
jgi:ribonucleoside-diphosphate reductase alpha chain